MHVCEKVALAHIAACIADVLSLVICQLQHYRIISHHLRIILTSIYHNPTIQLLCEMPQRSMRALPFLSHLYFGTGHCVALPAARSYRVHGAHAGQLRDCESTEAWLHPAASAFRMPGAKIEDCFDALQ